MARPSTLEALIYIMVVVSASDRDMTDVELGRIGQVVRTWPVFEGFDEEKIIPVAQDCRKRLHGKDGMPGVLALVGQAVPRNLSDTAYALAFEVASADLEMRLEERRILQLLQSHLALDADTVSAIERATKARHRTLT